jgi:hypothetical protein
MAKVVFTMLIALQISRAAYQVVLAWSWKCGVEA